MSDFVERISKLSPKRLALMAMELNARLERLERRTADPIAVIGIGCRFPGGVDGPDALWRFLRAGGNSISEIPPSRWDVNQHYDPNPDAPGKMNSRFGSFLADADGFDAKFFGITPREAVGIDPHQRMLLEVTWQALEHAGQPPNALAGSRTGVFIAPGNITDYFQKLLDGRSSTIDAYSVAGNAPSMASGRLSYLLGLQGPSLSVDTACSSSLVAVHLAAQSLGTGECRMAIAGGANMLLEPESTIGLSKARMLSPDGQCHTFDAGANGIVRGEGCGIVVLKRLTDAIADGDNVLAVIRATAINQDGRSNGITAPNGPAQESVIREALQRAGVQPADIDYVEAHGTGTPLGNPIEVRALGAVLRDGRAADRPVLIGSIKTNLGHMEFAAGIAGLLKVVLSLQHEEIPPHLHLRKPNPFIEWDDLPVAIPTEVTPWAAGSRRRLAGVSSFGFSGTNAHIIVEEAPPETNNRPADAGVERPMHLVTVSARTEHGCRQMAERLAEDMATHPDRSAADVAFTANAGRSHFGRRAAVLGRSITELSNRLTRVVTGQPDDATAFTGKTDSNPPEIAFIFTGQGSQYIGMGRELFETQPRFRQTLERCDQILRSRSNIPLLDILYPPPGSEAAAALHLNQTALTQPALFAIEYALADLWQSWGIRPSAVFGHSLGEYVAACVAGVFGLEDGLVLVAERARLMQELVADGAMAAVFADEARVAAALAPFADTVSIAAVNGPAHTVISGTRAHVDRALAALQAAGVSAKPLNVLRAFHSAMLDPMLPAFEQAASKVAYTVPQLEIVSNVTGRVETGSFFTNAAYWRRQTRQPVRFVDGVRALRASGCTVFLEIGPAPILSGMARECLDASDTLGLPSLRKGKSDWSQMLESLAALFVRGAAVDWLAFDADYARRKVALPTYVFQHERFWPPASTRHATAPVPDEAWRDWLYEFKWQAQEDGSGFDSNGALRAPADVAASASEGLPGLIETHGAAIYDEVYPALDALSAGYIVRALRQLGWEPGVGDLIELTSFRRERRILDRHTRLLGRMLDILTEDGFLESAAGGWRVLQVPPQGEGVRLSDLLARYPMCSAELSLTGHCGEQLAEVLSGTCDPLQLLFPGGSTQSAEDLYERAPAFRIYNAVAANVVASAISQLPAQRRVRVLELGAGTGGTSAYVLPRLNPERTEYVYTDISALFLSNAEEKFRAFPFITYRALDIERDPAAQGFANGQFDIVLASNVLHATADLDRTLQHARSLLAPGGLLVLIEGTQPQRFGDVTVGLTDGWWRFTDTNLRSYALVSSDLWIDRLKAAGFDSPVSFPDAGAMGHRIFSNQSILVAAAPRAGASSLKRSWLVCADAAGIGERVAQAARSKGDPAVVVEQGTEYCRIAADRFQVRPGSAEDFRRLLSDVAVPGVASLEALHLWSVDAFQTRGESTAETLDAEIERSCGSALHLAQALASTGECASRLTLVTCGAQAVASSGEGGSDVQAPIWGLGRAIEVEHPELRCTRVDLDPGSDARAGSRLYDLLSRAVPAESQVAIRGDVEHVLRVERAGSARTTGAGLDAFRADATYLITGGLTGLGLLVARWMAGKGARHLVLMGRRDPSASAQEAVDTLTRSGVSVRTVRGDISREDDVRRILADIGASDWPLRGVMHAAGVLDDGVLVQQTWDRFARVMAPKVRGTWLLDRLTRSSALDFFVMFSSGASFLGSPGQSNHAAANAYIDAVAHRRRAEGLPALSINWGAWSGTGAATHGGIVERAEAGGLGAIDPDRGLRVLEHAMTAAAAQVAVLPIQWSVFATAAGARGRLFDRVVPGDAVKTAAAASAPAVNPAAWLEEVTPGRLRPMLLDRVHQEAVRVMRLDPGDSIDLRQALSELGLDSLMAVELRNALGALTGRTLSGTLLFNYPTIDELVDHLAGEIEGSQRAADPGSQSPAADVSDADLEALSTDDVAKLLAARLQEM